MILCLLQYSDFSYVLWWWVSNLSLALPSFCRVKRQSPLWTFCHRSLKVRRHMDMSSHVPHLVYCHTSCFSMWSLMLRITLKGLQGQTAVSRTPMWETVKVHWLHLGLSPGYWLGNSWVSHLERLMSTAGPVLCSAFRPALPLGFWGSRNKDSVKPFPSTLFTWSDPMFPSGSDTTPLGSH